jgi:16S rRNA (cytosine967-C5)-methyltransferase
LARAIHRTTLQRWLTLEYLLDRHLNQPLRKLEPELAAILLSGAAQIVLMQRVPTFAAVDEAVSLAKARLRRRAGGLVNAVLRKLADDVAAIEPAVPWQPAADQLPLEQGRVRLAGDILPSPDEQERHLSVVTSHGPSLVEHWLEQLGPERTQALCLHGLTHPPTIVAVEANFDTTTPPANEMWAAHAQPGFIVWRGTYGQLVEFLSAHPARRVQDPAAALAVRATAELTPTSVLDLCAGRGTKTRQLAAVHPEARIVATDINPQRQAELVELGKEHNHIDVVAFDQIPAGPYDLVLLDVPCSNTGVLARRPEARYRFTKRSLHELVGHQRQIIRQAMPYVSPTGHVLYTTCSIDAAENQQQTDFIEQQTAGEVVAEDRWLPAGEETTYHDGSYHALVKMGKT